jgi:hypothetical protein
MHRQMIKVIRTLIMMKKSLHQEKMMKRRKMMKNMQVSMALRLIMLTLSLPKAII